MFGRDKIDWMRKRDLIPRPVHALLVCSSLLISPKVLAQERVDPVETLELFRASSQNIAALSYDAIVAPERARPWSLIEFAAQDSTKADPSDALRMVYALSSVLDYGRAGADTSTIEGAGLDERLAIENTLASWARPTTGDNPGPPALPASPQRRQHLATQRHFGSVMLALVQTNSTQNLAQVLSYALNEDFTDRWLQKAAQDALLSQPDFANRLAQLKVLAPDLRRQLSANTHRQSEAPSLELLMTEAKEKPAQFERKIAEFARSMAQTTSANAGQSVLLKQKRAFFARANWDKALLHDPLWSLRLATLLHQHLPRKLVRSIGKVAERYRHQQTDLGSSARWYLRVTSSTNAKEPLLTVSQETALKGEPVAQHGDPSTWRSLSTRQLWSRYENSRPYYAIAALCSRYSPRLTANEQTEFSLDDTPNTKQVRLWLSDDDHGTSAACLWGLGVSRPKQALPLLINLYFLESDPVVRTPLTATLVAYLGTHHALLRRIAVLDADPTCRKIADGENSASYLGFFVGHGSSQMNIITRQGKTYTLRPARDGFMAAVDPEL